MNDIIKETIDEFLKNEVVMEYHYNNNQIIGNDIHNLLSLLLKFKNELIEDVMTKQNNGEKVSKNEFIIKKTENDINELIKDLKHLS